jgi:hypothetical protein
MAQEKKLRQSYAELQAQVAQLSAVLQQVQQAFSGNAEVLSAVVSLLGEDSVTQELERLRSERQQKQEDQMAEGVKTLLDAGVLRTTETVSEDSLVVGFDTLPNGKQRRVQFEARAVPEDLRPKFYGKKAGEAIENNGTTLTVTEVYTVDKVRAAEYQKEQQTKAMAATLMEKHAEVEPSAAEAAGGEQASEPEAPPVEAAPETAPQA